MRGEQFFIRPRAAFWAGLALVGVVIAVAAVIPAGPLAVDQRWSEAMVDVQTSRLHDLALVFNYLGRGVGRGVSLAAIGFALVAARRWQALIAFAAAESLTPLAVNALKALVDRPRPPDAMLDAAGSSFPSGHAAYAGATALALVVLFTRQGSRKRRVSAVAAVVVVAGMAWSRTYLQVHWLTDALSGALLGLGIALATFAAVQCIKRYGASSG